MPWITGSAGWWEGGRIWLDHRGRKTYFIRKTIGGKAYEYTTRRSTEHAAKIELARFMDDPEGYEPGAVSSDALRLSADLVRPFLAWSVAPAREGGKGNSRPWVLQQKAYLAWWATQLKGRDLRKLSLPDHVLPALDGVPGRKHRIETLKAFFSWLRKERHFLTRAQDVCLDLTVPAPRPEQWTTPKAIPRASFLRVIAKLEGDHRDGLQLLDETGWHVSELVRFARAGEIEPVPAGRADDAAAILVRRHKNGEPLRTAVGANGKAAAERLRAKGTFSVSRFYEAIKKASDRLVDEGQIPEAITPGRMRHTLATRAVEAGATPQAVSAYLGHKSEATTKRFYATLAAPPRVEVTPRDHGSPKRRRNARASEKSAGE